MAFLDPYAVDGATITGAQLRQDAYAAVKGESGVFTPTALKMVGIPGSPGLVGVMPGAGAITVAARAETYMVSNTAMDGDALVEVPPAGSSSVTRYGIVEVSDPGQQGGGDEPGVRFRLVSSLSGLTRPYLALGRFTLPAGGGFDANTPITDLRSVVMPREWRRLFTHNLTGSEEHALTETSGAGQYWPDIPDNIWQVDIPEWATHANIVATWGGVRVSYSGAEGVVYVRLGRPEGYGEGNVRTQDQRWALDPSMDAGRAVRETWTAADDIAIPAALRGTTQPIRGIGRMLVSGGPPRLDNASSILIDVQFTEGPA